MQLSDWLTEATRRLIAAGISPEEARLEARLLAQHALGFTREQLITRSQVPVDTELLEFLLARRLTREPLAYLLGERGFYGMDFYVTPAVLIPRPETELLVETVLEYFGELPIPYLTPNPSPGHSFVVGRGASEGLSETPPPSARNERPGEGAGGRGNTLADIGTGSGCIAVTLATYLPDVSVFATDISAEALEVARRNAARHGAAVTLLQGDLLSPLPEGLFFEVLVSNPPYIAPAEVGTLAPEVLGEPHTALFDLETDGLGFYRRLTTEAPPRLKPGGLLAVEVGQGQAEPVATLFSAAGFTEVSILPDLAGIGRVVRGIWRPWPKTASHGEVEPL